MVLFQLTGLMDLNLAQNILSGRVQKEIGNLSKMQYLSLVINNLSSPVPPEFGNLNQLILLDEDFKNASESIRGSFIGYKTEIEELEMLLEAYFVQTDGTLNKLSTLREYVDDTEDYINIMLDEKQNQLLQMGVMLSTLTLVITAGVVVVGILGMNIRIDLFKAPYYKFWETTFSICGACVVLYILAIGWGKKSGLLR